MRRAVPFLPLALILVVAGCGRLGFDALGRTDDGALAGSGDGGGDTGGTGSPDAALVPAGPAVWLRMETDPAVAIIDSGGGHTVSCNGPCPTAGAGKNGRGFRFTMNQIDIAPAADLDSSSGFTAGIWVNVTQLPSSTACFWTKAFDNANGYDTFTLCVDPTGKSVYDCELPGGGAGVIETGPTLTLGTWHHLALSWDGSNKSDYFDGVRVAGGSHAIGSGNQGMALGASRSAYYVNAMLDDAIYYTRALSAAEIAQLAGP